MDLELVRDVRSIVRLIARAFRVLSKDGMAALVDLVVDLFVANNLAEERRACQRLFNRVLKLMTGQPTLPQAVIILSIAGIAYQVHQDFQNPPDRNRWLVGLDRAMRIASDDGYGIGSKIALISREFSMIVTGFIKDCIVAIIAAFGVAVKEAFNRLMALVNWVRTQCLQAANPMLQLAPVGVQA